MYEVDAVRTRTWPSPGTVCSSLQLVSAGKARDQRQDHEKHVMHFYLKYSVAWTSGQQRWWLASVCKQEPMKVVWISCILLPLLYAGYVDVCSALCTHSDVPHSRPDDWALNFYSQALVAAVDRFTALTRQRSTSIHLMNSLSFLIISLTPIALKQLHLHHSEYILLIIIAAVHGNQHDGLLLIAT